MKAKCPHCAAVYSIKDSLVPPAGRRAKCRRCGDRFLIAPPKPESAPKKSPKPKKPAPEKADWKETRYQKLFRRLNAFYQEQDAEFHYRFTGFSFQHRAVEDAEYIKKQVQMLREALQVAQKAAQEARRSADEDDLERQGLEIARLKASLRIFKELVGLKKSLAAQGLPATYNEIYNVLRDVDRIRTGG